MTTHICSRNYSGDGSAPASGKKAPVASLRSSGGIDRGVCGETRELLRAGRRNMALSESSFLDFAPCYAGPSWRDPALLAAVAPCPGAALRPWVLRLHDFGELDAHEARRAGRGRAAGVQKGCHVALSGLCPGRIAGVKNPWDPGFRPSGRKSSRVRPQTPRSISPQERKEATGAFFPEAGADPSPE